MHEHVLFNHRFVFFALISPQADSQRLCDLLSYEYKFFVPFHQLIEQNIQIEICHEVLSLIVSLISVQTSDIIVSHN